MDPYPVDLKEFDGIKLHRKILNHFSLEDFYQSIVNGISKLTQFQPQLYVINQKNEHRILVDPVLSGSRHQPIVIELVYDHIGSGFTGKSVYCLKMKTPLAPYSKYRHLKDLFYDAAIQSVYHPGVKLCIDPVQMSGNSWGIYMSTELPLFVEDLSINPLSEEEIQEAFSSLVICADTTESLIFQRDLRKEELNLVIGDLRKETNRVFRKAEKQTRLNKWLTKDSYHILETIVEQSEVSSFFEKQALVMNHESMYVKTFSEKGVWKHQVAFLNKDAFKDELDLLEKHYKVFLNEKHWK
jgi:hypothetical protein